MLSQHSAPRGTLYVRVLEGQNLKNEDTLGHNDPFVELWLDEDYKQRTEVLKNTDSPIWDQEFTFPIEEGSSKHKLYIKVLDKDHLDTEKIGEGKLDITSAFEGNELDELVELPAHLHLSDHGKIHLVVRFEAEA